jgi:hypothetical protein
MRFRLAIVLGTFVLGLYSFSVYATGNVLVPSDNTPAKPTTPSDQSQSNEPTLPVIDPNYSTPPTPVTPGGFTPAKPGAAASKIPLGSTKIIRIPAPQALSVPTSEDPTTGVNVDIDQKSVWGKNDLANINRSLGIDKDKAAKICHLSINGSVETSEGLSPFSMNPNVMHTLVRYGGTPSGIILMLQAMCETVPLPPNKGYVTQVGDKYSVFLHRVTCPPPPPKTLNIVFSYAGDGKGECHFH